MMSKTKPTDFAVALRKYLFEFLPEQKGLSENTIKSYADSLSLFLDFCESELHFKREKIEVSDISRENVERFLDWIENARQVSVATRDNRRVALNGFFKYLQYLNPGYVLLCQQILSIPSKKDQKRIIKHLSVEAIQAILKQPKLTDRRGRRDFAILCLMYESAARVSEIVDLRVGDIFFDRSGTTVRLFGKGQKTREVPLVDDVTALLKRYLADEKATRLCDKVEPLFCNRNKAKMTRAGISYVLNKYVTLARETHPELFPERVHPHILRHSRAVHWLESGIDLYYIKDLLGHRDIVTTEVYAQINTTMKRKILEAVHEPIEGILQTSWTDDRSMMNWLNSFAGDND
jgi:site-specific recombinase XerD